MTHAIHTSLSPMGDDSPPEINMAGENHNIPCVTFADRRHGMHSVTLMLGNHDDPEGYLRATAERLLVLADLVAARTTVPA